MHKGKYIHQKMIDMGVSLDRMAIELSVARTTLWRWLNNKNLPIFKMKRIADVLKLDLRVDFPESIEYYTKNIDKKEVPKDYQLLYLKELEKNRELQEEIAVYKRIVSPGTESGR